MTITLLLYYLKLNFLIFTNGLQSSLILFIRTYKPTAGYRDVLDRLHVCLNIILFFTVFFFPFPPLFFLFLIRVPFPFYTQGLASLV